jgi:outer membrane immunogenic protein
MRKSLVSLLALLAFPAMAADYPQKAQSYVPYANTSWTSNWIGIQGGWAGQGSLDNPFTSFPTDGYFGGLNIGTQRQYGSWVLGLELEGNYGKIDGSSTIAGVIAVNHEVEAHGSLRARIGYATSQFHLYGLGGLALASTNASIAAGPFSASDSKTHWGYVIGAGLEYAVAPNWVLGAEYNYYSFSGENYGFALAGPIGLVTPADFDFHVVKARALYKW